MKVKFPKLPLTKGKKKLVIGITASVLAVAAVAGIALRAPSGGETIGVYSFDYLGMTEYWGDNQESYGPVSSDKIQTVFLTDTQIVTEILVKEGDTVKKGDKLLSFDTTLDDLALEKKRLAVEKAKLDLQDAEHELIDVGNLVPSDKNEEPPEETIEPDLGEELVSAYQISKDIRFDGTAKEKALICWLKDSTGIDDALLHQIWQKAAEYQTMNLPEPPSSASAVPETTVPEASATEAPTQPQTTPATEAVTESVPETTAPTMETTAPSEAPTEPAAETTAPTEMPTDPTQETTEPTVETTAPTEETTEPTEETTEPTEETTEPTEETTEPTEETTEPTEETTEPTEETTEPTEEATEPTEPSEPAGPASDIYVVFKVTEGNKSLGAVQLWQGLHVFRHEDGSYSFKFYDAAGFEDHTLPSEEESLPSFDFTISYTAKEIAQMRAELRKQIKELEFKLKMAEAEYKIMQREVSDGHVYAEVDGEVVSALPEEEARASRQPVLKVSGGGGFYVEGSVSELEKDNMQPGMEVTINDWNTGMTYTGKVESIGDFPSNNNGWNGLGNPNASYYPFQVFIDGSADLQSGSYVSIMYSTSEGGNGIYLENAFLRTEGGQSYVFALGKDGKLEKRTIVTGKSLWGSYTEVLSGITAEDLLAFPYGKNVKHGAPAEEKDISSLYEY